MSNSQFWANFGLDAANTLFDKVLEVRKNDKASEVDALKETVKDQQEHIQKLENEKVMLIREVARLEYRLELAQGEVD